MFGDVTAPIRPQRVVTLLGAAGPVLSAGLTPVAVVDSTVDLLPEESSKLTGVPHVVKPNGPVDEDGAPMPDLDAIRPARPDLIIGTDYSSSSGPTPAQRAAHDNLKGIAPTVILPTEPAARSGWDDNVRVAEIV